MFYFMFCMSSVLHRPDSQKTSVSPDPGMLRKLVRDRNCRPVFRGILESLLRYLTQDLLKRTILNKNPEKPGSDIVFERNTDWSDQTINSSVKQTQLQTSCIDAKLPKEHKIILEKSAETEKCPSGPEKERLPSRLRGDQKAGDLIPRRLTTFQLLQSKFLRSTPKPPITHQREVGTLSSSKGVAGDVNHCKDGEHSMQNKDRTRREQGLKRGGSVKVIVAKFAMAEQKEKGENMLKKQPMKPRLLRRGILLSSLMERFETMATVCKGSDLKRSREKPSGGVDMTSNLQQRLVEQQVSDQTEHTQNQHKQMKIKSVGKQLKRNQTTSLQERRTKEAEDILKEANPKEKNNFKAEGMRQNEDERLNQKSDVHSSSKHVNAQVYHQHVNGQMSEEYGEIPTTVEETQMTNKLKYGHQELLCSTSMTESLLPEPYRIVTQEEAQVNWHVATVMACSPVWSTCVDSSPKQYSESSPINLKTEVPQRDLQCKDSSTGQPATTITDERCLLKPETGGLSTYTGHNPVENVAVEGLSSSKAVTFQRLLPLYVIPCDYRFDYQRDIDDQTDSSLQSELQPETIFPLDATSPTNADVSMTAFNTGVLTCTSNNRNGQTLRLTTEEKAQEKEVGTVDIKDGMLQTLRLSECDAAAFEDSETSAVTSQRPKYTTISYGDPSVKQTYTPKIIRFTDTFTF